MSGNPSIKQPFSNMQLELLKLYASDVSDEDLLAIKDLLAKYFLAKAKDAADKAWDERELSEEKLMKVHHRTPYPKTK